jgi:hypothetical protein
MSIQGRTLLRFLSKKATTLAFMSAWNARLSNFSGSEQMPGGLSKPQGARNEKWPAPGTE